LISVGQPFDDGRGITLKTMSLDVSASSTGWAIIVPGDIRRLLETNRPDWLQLLDVLGISRVSKNWRVFGDGEWSVAHGAWRLKTEWSREGEPHDKLIANLTTLRRVFGIENVIYERALTPEQRGGASNPSNDILIELLGAVKLFHFRANMRLLIGVHRNSWQSDWIGRQPRGTKRKTLIELIEERAYQLGFTCRKNDEAAALGVLTSWLLREKFTPPWLAEEVLRPALGVPA
jgi:hypothetical protein